MMEMQTGEASMQTKVDVEASLLERAMKATGGKSERDTVEQALHAAIERSERLRHDLFIEPHADHGGDQTGRLPQGS
ncbi:Arc/MetJ family transcription regulator [Rhizobium sp. SG_E_25_P2]|uniref:type II toxin-antitoxin system VapB family antitoxin n=1 Tax=Rhizobium sp. SG_E_25_P2 TaxID=2879942 RepID=UPI0024764925|nr:type II toxin-antitoxin system VapB family antitoxin [Rhizobium sp. SG_E_25_P2]MDH6267074.1 Arc/MetJ family transcription regulator [Rhizobium sp. SG_E_25_P2]